MSLYTVRLQSVTDDQWRLRTLEADDAKDARKIVERREANRAAYDLTALRPVQAVQTRRHQDGVHATVNLSVFSDSGLGGRDLLDFVERDHAIDGDGRAYGPHKYLKSHLQAHYQREPYKIVSVDK